MVGKISGYCLLSAALCVALFAQRPAQALDDYALLEQLVVEGLITEDELNTVIEPAPTPVQDSCPDETQTTTGSQTFTFCCSDSLYQAGDPRNCSTRAQAAEDQVIGPCREKFHKEHPTCNPEPRPSCDCRVYDQDEEEWVTKKGQCSSSDGTPDTTTSVQTKQSRALTVCSGGYYGYKTTVTVSCTAKRTCDRSCRPLTPERVKERPVEAVLVD